MFNDSSGRSTAELQATRVVTADVIRHVGALASLELTAAEELGLERDLNAILGHIAELNQLDTTGVEPMAQVSDLLHGATEPLRTDEPRPSLDRARVMSGAPATDGTFFKVPKVIER